MERSPAFQFYPADFLSDPNVAGMSLQERGAYITLICLCWKDGSLPLEDERLARMVGLPLSNWRKLAPIVVGCFTTVDGRLVHRRLDKERQKQLAFQAEQQVKGKAGAEARWAEHRKRKADGRGHLSAMAETKPRAAMPGPMPADGSSVFSLQTSVKTQTPTESSSTRPRTFGRIDLHRWQTEALIASLGPLAADFDLDAWILGLSALADERRLVLDRKTLWPWVQSELRAECERRGLAVAGSTSGPVGSRRRWVPEDCRHEPHCGNATNCANRTVMEQFKAERVS